MDRKSAWPRALASPNGNREISSTRAILLSILALVLISKAVSARARARVKKMKYPGWPSNTGSQPPEFRPTRQRPGDAYLDQPGLPPGGLAPHQRIRY